MKNTLSSITLPLVQSSVNVSHALDVAKLRGAGAVAASDGAAFRVYSVTTLHDAAVQGADQMALHGLEGVTLPSLSMPEAVTLKLGTPANYTGQVQEILNRFDTKAIITSVNLAPDGGVLIAFNDPTGGFERIVRPVYYCPKGLETTWGPGHCNVHNVDYQLQNT